MKRLVDLVFSMMGLLGTLPIYPIIVFCIFVESPGSVFFRQTRIGRHGRPFKIIKFRSMRTLPEGGSARFDPGDVSRVTKIGTILRKTKMDELPQLINVFLGDMSLVGPRPEIQKWVDIYPERWSVILEVRPGITDPASILYRDEEKILASYNDPEEAYKNIVLPKKLEMYEEYVRNHTLLGDLRILLQTFLKLTLR